MVDWPKPAGREGRNLVPLRTSPAARASQLQAEARAHGKESALELAAALAHVAQLAGDVASLSGALPPGVIQEAERSAREASRSAEAMTSLVTRLL